MQYLVMDRRSVTSASAEMPSTSVKKEPMFEKIVTPSDVGKLNRLVIPKQHAEKHLPLNTSTDGKGLILNFEDRDGKPWCFRYSYWNSSQSYVMTRGWSRFVKEKRLAAGDTVIFERGADDKDRLFIDWKRRPVVIQNLPRVLMTADIPQRAGRLMGPPSAVVYNAAAGIVFRSPVVAPPQEEFCGGKIEAERVRLFGVNLDSPQKESETTSCSSFLGLPPKGKEEEDPLLDLEM